MQIDRRKFLKLMGLGIGYTILPFGKTGLAFAADAPVDNHLVIIMMRGAVDGLSVVVPYSEAAYYKNRPNISIAKPGTNNGAIDLDGRFGLNPALAPIMPLWNDKTLAFVHASGSPAETRSHFEAQDIMETASEKSGTTGWMNRLVQVLPTTNSSNRALSFGDTLPKIFEGQYNIATVPRGIKAGNSKMDFDNPKIGGAFDSLYKNNPQLHSLYTDAVSSHETMIADLNEEMVTSSQGAAQPDQFVSECQKLATMMKRDSKIQVAFMDVGGWDTHINQGNAQGQLANKLGKLGQAVMALASGLGERYRDTTIIVMSEFGRTVAENGNQGTDHGHGNVMWVSGGKVSGGKVYGEWPGLEQSQLHEQRDLAITTDFRSVIGQVLSNQFNLTTPQITQILDGYKPNASLSGLV